MTKTTLPKDGFNNPIQAVRLAPSKAHKINFTSSEVKNSTPIDGETRILSLYSTKDCFIEVGTSTVVADNTKHFIPSSTYLYIALIDNEASHSTRDTHISVLSNGEDGILYVSERI